MTTTKPLTPEQHGADDAESRVDDTQISTGVGSCEAAASMLRAGGEEPDAALINALGWQGVYELAGLAYDRDVDHPTADALAWCERYNAGWAARLAEIAATPEITAVSQ